jgi:uncharacterized protein (DUF488 family)
MIRDLSTELIDITKGRLPSTWKVYETPYLFSIGYEGKSIVTFIDELINNKILALVDVRHNPLSRKPGFSKVALRSHLEHSGIDYFHIPQLGIPSQFRKNLGTEESYRLLFNFYDKEILPSNLIFVAKLKELLNQYHRLAIMCFEADFHTCHRYRITEFISNDSAFDVEITHL